MADLNPEDIKEPPESVPISPWVAKTPEDEPEPEPLPPDDEGADEEEEKKEPDLAAAVEHLTVAVAELARAAGSPPVVADALERARQALGM